MAEKKSAAIPWLQQQEFAEPETPKTSSFGDIFNNIGAWGRAAYADTMAIPMGRQIKDVYDKIENGQYSSREEYDSLVADLDRLQNERNEYRDAFNENQKILNQNDSYLKDFTEIGGTVQGIGRQARDTLIGAGLGAIGGSVVPVAGTASGAMTGARIGNFIGSIDQAAQDADTNAIDAWEKVLQEGGTSEQAEQAYKDAFWNNMPTEALDILSSLYMGGKLLGSTGKILNRALGGKLAGTLANGVNKVARFDLPAKLGTYVANKSGQAWLGQGVGVGLGMLENAVEEGVQEPWQDYETERAIDKQRRIYDPTNQLNKDVRDHSIFGDGGLLDYYTTEEGMNTAIKAAKMGAVFGGAGGLMSKSQYTELGTAHSDSIQSAKREADWIDKQGLLKDKGNLERYNNIKETMANVYDLSEDEKADLSVEDVARMYHEYYTNLFGQGGNRQEQNAVSQADFLNEITGEETARRGLMGDTATKYIDEFGIRPDNETLVGINDNQQVLSEEQVQETLNQDEEETTGEETENKEGIKAKASKPDFFDDKTSEQAKEEKASSETQNVIQKKKKGIPDKFGNWKKIEEDDGFDHDLNNIGAEAKYENTKTGRIAHIKRTKAGYQVTDVTDPKDQGKTRNKDGKKKLLNFLQSSFANQKTKFMSDGTQGQEQVSQALPKEDGVISEINSDKITEDAEKNQWYNGRKIQSNKAVTLHSMQDLHDYYKTHKDLMSKDLYAEISRQMMRFGIGNANNTEVVLDLTNREAGGFGSETAVRTDPNDENSAVAKAIVRLYAGADLATAAHEMAHLGWMNLSDQDRATFAKWAEKTQGEFIAKILGMDYDQNFRSYLIEALTNRESKTSQDLWAKIKREGAVQQTLGILNGQNYGLAVEERFAWEFSNWYAQGYIKGAKPRNIIERILNKACATLQGALNLLTDTNRYLNGENGYNGGDINNIFTNMSTRGIGQQRQTVAPQVELRTEMTQPIQESPYNLRQGVDETFEEGLYNSPQQNLGRNTGTVGAQTYETPQVEERPEQDLSRNTGNVPKMARTEGVTRKPTKYTPPPTVDQRVEQMNRGLKDEYLDIDNPQTSPVNNQTLQPSQEDLYNQSLIEGLKSDQKAEVERVKQVRKQQEQERKATEKAEKERQKQIEKEKKEKQKKKDDLKKNAESKIKSANSELNKKNPNLDDINNQITEVEKAIKEFSDEEYTQRMEQGINTPMSSEDKGTINRLQDGLKKLRDKFNDIKEKKPNKSVENSNLTNENQGGTIEENPTGAVENQTGEVAESGETENTRGTENLQGNVGEVQRGGSVRQGNDNRTGEGRVGQNSVEERSEGNGKDISLLKNSKFKSVYNARKEKKTEVKDWRDLSDSDQAKQVYVDALNASKEANKDYGVYVSEQTVESLKDCKVVLHKNKMAGFAITPDGNIVGVFSNPKNPIRGILNDMIFIAHMMGGNSMDCFGSFLLHGYRACGFTPVARTTFDEAYYPADNPANATIRKEKPDVFFLVKDNDNNTAYLDKMNKGEYENNQIAIDDIPLIDSEDSYGDALGFQGQVLKEIQKKENKNKSTKEVADSLRPKEETATETQETTEQTKDNQTEEDAAKTDKSETTNTENSVKEEAIHKFAKKWRPENQTPAKVLKSKGYRFNEKQKDSAMEYKIKILGVLKGDDVLNKLGEEKEDLENKVKECKSQFEDALAHGKSTEEITRNWNLYKYLLEYVKDAEKVMSNIQEKQNKSQTETPVQNSQVEQPVATKSEPVVAKNETTENEKNNKEQVRKTMEQEMLLNREIDDIKGDHADGKISYEEALNKFNEVEKEINSLQFPESEQGRISNLLDNLKFARDIAESDNRRLHPEIEQAEKQKKIEEENKEYNGFLDNMSPMTRGKTIKQLSQKRNYGKDGGIMTKKAFIEKEVKNDSVFMQYITGDGYYLQYDDGTQRKIQQTDALYYQHLSDQIIEKEEAEKEQKRQEKRKDMPEDRWSKYRDKDGNIESDSEGVHHSNGDEIESPIFDIYDDPDSVSDAEDYIDALVSYDPSGTLLSNLKKKINDYQNTKNPVGEVEYWDDAIEAIEEEQENRRDNDGYVSSDDNGSPWTSRMIMDNMKEHAEYLQKQNEEESEVEEQTTPQTKTATETNTETNQTTIDKSDNNYQKAVELVIKNRGMSTTGLRFALENEGIKLGRDKVEQYLVQMENDGIVEHGDEGSLRLLKKNPSTKMQEAGQNAENQTLLTPQVEEELENLFWKLIRKKQFHGMDSRWASGSLDYYKSLSNRRQGKEFNPEFVKEDKAFLDAIKNVNDYIHEKFPQYKNVYRGVDGHWRFEFSDKDAHFINGFEKLSGKTLDTTLDKILKHDNLYKFYSKLKGMPVHLVRNTKMQELMEDTENQYYAMYDPDERAIYINSDMFESSDELRNSLLHEIQHAIQDIEGFANGTNDNAYNNDYDFSEGEKQAVLTEKRSNMSDEELQQNPRSKTLNPKEKTIIQEQRPVKKVAKTERINKDGNVTVQAIKEAIDRDKSIDEQIELLDKVSKNLDFSMLIGNNEKRGLNKYISNKDIDTIRDSLISFAMDNPSRIITKKNVERLKQICEEEMRRYKQIYMTQTGIHQEVALEEYKKYNNELQATKSLLNNMPENGQIRLLTIGEQKENNVIDITNRGRKTTTPSTKMQSNGQNNLGYIDKQKDIYSVTFTKSAQKNGENQKKIAFYRNNKSYWRENKDAQTGSITFTRALPYQQHQKTIIYDEINGKKVGKRKKAKWREYYEAFKDHVIKWLFNDKHFLEKAARNVGAIEAYMRMMVMKDQGAVAGAAIEDGIVKHNGKNGERTKSLNSIIEAVGEENQTDFLNYCEAYRVLDLEKRNIYQKMTPDDARKEIAKVQRSKNAKLFEEQRKNFVEYNHELLWVLVDGGFITEKQYDNFIKIDPNFIPLAKNMDELEGYVDGFKDSKTMINVAHPMHKIGTSMREVANPFLEMQKRTVEYYVKASRNKAGHIFVHDIAEAIAQNAKGDVVAQNQGMVRKLASRDRNGKPISHDNKQYVFYVWENGEKQYYQVADREIYVALKSFDAEQMGALSKIMNATAGKASRLVRNTATMTPDFGLRNLVRDNMEAFISSEHGFLPLVDSLWGMYQMANDTQWFKEYQRMNGEHLSLNRDGEDVATVEHDIKDNVKFYKTIVPLFKKDLHEFMDKDRSKPARAKSLLKLVALDIVPLQSIYKANKRLNDYLETGTRIGEYRNARMGYKGLKGRLFETSGSTIWTTDMDLSRAKNTEMIAAYKSKDITLNFGQHGVLGKELNRYIPFFNASLQGIYKLGNTLDDMIHAEDARRRQELMFKCALMGAMGMAAALAGQGDDDYDEAPDYEHENFWILPNGIRIPKDQLFGKLIGGTVEKATAQYLKDGDVKKLELVQDILGNFAIDKCVPALVDLGWGTIGNYDSFKKKSVTPEYMADKLGYLQKDLSTSKAGADISKAIFDFTKGVFGTPVDVGAKKVDFVISKTLSNLGKYATSLWELTGGNEKMTRGAEVEDKGGFAETSKELPYPLNQIVGTFATNRNSFQSISDFYERHRELKKLSSDESIMSKNEKKAWEAYQAAYKKDKQYRDALKAIKLDKSLTGAQKRQKADKIFKQQISMARKLHDWEKKHGLV